MVTASGDMAQRDIEGGHGKGVLEGGEVREEDWDSQTCIQRVTFLCLCLSHE